MKQIQVVILIFIVITVFFSASTIAKIDESAAVKFLWYSSYEGAFLSSTRDTSSDEWLASENERKIQVRYINSESEIDTYVMPEFVDGIKKTNIDFKKNVLIQFKFSESKPFGYRLKTLEILKNSGKIYFRLSLSGFKSSDKSNSLKKKGVCDLILLNRNDINTIPETQYIFKDEYGNKLDEIAS
ncbi:MAG: hypothetical protein WCQ41_03025 [Bacillota bacterium]